MTTRSSHLKELIRRLCAGPLLRRTITWRVATREPIVAITFDDGPNAHTTPAVLGLLADQRVVATFFVQGNQVERNPEILRRILGAGHEIGNHSYDHSKRNPFAQARLCDDVLERQGIRTRLFRPPGGTLRPGDLLRLAAAHYTTVLWSLDAVDSMREEGKWRGSDPDYSSVRGGDIVLMHDDNAACLRDLPKLFRVISERGLVPVTVSRLLRAR